MSSKRRDSLAESVPVCISMDTCESTMDEAMRVCEEHPGRVVIVTAKTQLKGRGSKGRKWMDLGERSLLFTVGMPLGQVKQLQHCAFAATVSVLEALQASFRNICLRDFVMAKWPNDVLLRGDGRKVCGNLVEVRSGTMLVGFGCNVEEAPEVCDGGRRAACLKDAVDTDRFDRVKFVVMVQKCLVQYLTADSPGVCMGLWRGWVDWDAPVFLRDDPERLPHKVIDVDEDGFLIVQSASGERKTLVDTYLV